MFLPFVPCAACMLAACPFIVINEWELCVDCMDCCGLLRPYGTANQWVRWICVLRLRIRQKQIVFDINRQ